jgi:glycosyltransferase involved in cell wall biosynthesis
MADALEVRLDAPLPAEVGVGGGTALFVAGTAFAPGARIAQLSLLVDGEPQPVAAHGMPRLDTMRALGPPESYRSGFWGLARLTARPAGASVELAVRAELAGGGTAEAELATLTVTAPPEPAPPPPSRPAGGPLVAICMATHEPPPKLLGRQIESIRAQTHADWLCVVSDDCSSAAGTAALRDAIGDDPRFVVSRSPRRLGFYRNFERALSLAPSEADFVALSDQDDEWRPHKLATLLAEIGDARLAYSDARIVREDGRVVADTYWSARANRHDDLLSLLAANAVTGAASLFPRTLLDDALPFPPAQFAHFHDHWLALVALSLGEIRFVPEPLYDYVQHGDATLGHETATRIVRLRSRLAGWRRGPRERIGMWRMHYFVDGARLLQEAAILRLRLGERMLPDPRRALARLERADRSPTAVGALAARGLRDLLRRRPETLGAEWMLAHAFAWRRLLALTAGAGPGARLRLDAVPPPALDPAPGARVPAEPAPRAIADKIAPLRMGVRDYAPRRINVLVPTFDLRHLFAGYIGKLNLARRLAERGHRVRVVTVDPVGALPRSWRADVEAYSGLAGLFERVEVAFGREAQGLEVSREDAWVASTWWTAHIAHRALAELGGERFLYLIQEYEPFTFPMGTYAALAEESYRFPHDALFSTALLRDWFRLRGLGVFARDGRSAVFENAITPVPPPSAAELAGRRPRRLLFYARPEPHAARNMFELGVLALARALERGGLAGFTLHGIGTVGGSRRLDLGGGASLELLPRSAQRDYAELLRRHDVGLALMFTPHPSLVPIEMASAGMLAVTNSFENKTAQAMAAISSNIVAAEPGIETVAAALCEAAAGVEDVDRRVRGSAVRWARNWDDAFPDELIDRVAGWLGR